VEQRKVRIAAQSERNATRAAELISEKLETENVPLSTLVPVFAEIVSDGFPILHSADSAAFALHTVGADRAGTPPTAQIYIEKSRSYSFGNLLDAI
jgi:hypothetical protein